MRSTELALNKYSLVVWEKIKLGMSFMRKINSSSLGENTLFLACDLNQSNTDDLESSTSVP